MNQVSTGLPFADGHPHDRMIRKSRVIFYDIVYTSDRIHRSFEQAFISGGRYYRTRDPVFVQVTVNPSNVGTAWVRYPDGLTEIVVSEDRTLQGISLADYLSARRAAKRHFSSQSFELLLLKNRGALMRVQNFGRSNMKN